MPQLKQSLHAAAGTWHSQKKFFFYCLCYMQSKNSNDDTGKETEGRKTLIDFS